MLWRRIREVEQVRPKSMLHTQNHCKAYWILYAGNLVIAAATKSACIRVERRHPEELEVVERLEVGAVDQRSALRLEPDGDAGTREERAVVADEGHIGGPSDADATRLGALFADAVADRGEHVGVWKAVDRRAKPVAA